MNDFKLQKYRDLGDILTDSFLYIKHHYKSLGKALLLLAAPFYLISGFLVGDAYSSFFSAMFNNPEAAESMITPGFMIGMLMLVMSSVALMTVTLTHIGVANEQDTVELSDITDRFGMNFIMLFLLYVLIILAVSVSFLFFIIPGIYVGIKLFVSPTVSILERKNPLEAITRSWQLVQGHWWFTFATYLVMNIVTSFMSYVLIIPLGIVMSFFSSAGAESSQSFVNMIGILYGLMILFASLFTVILLIALALHYFNLIERKEGKGLKAQIEELG
ncbi:hypothetical protein [Gracilimonas sp.]|uniref:hypothetical protein n=1 Tax=Gracilimonas sp. TaxID=1974203 RepID=UPI002871BF78|nr:hypothetical protein [Gracilimonas sp.]